LSLILLSLIHTCVREIFLRELISNANDAIEKLRITSLTDKSVWNGGDLLNITIKAEKSEDGKSGKLVISDTGIGMSDQELATNLVSEFFIEVKDAYGVSRVPLQNLAPLSFLREPREKELLKET